MKTVTVTSLKKKLWTVFSKYIRMRDGYICFTCGEQKDKATTNAGHFKHGLLDFDEVNIHCQCIRCNHYLSGNLAVYAERLIETYGIREFNDLCFRAKIAQRGEIFTAKELIAKLLLYKEKVKKYGE